MYKDFGATRTFKNLAATFASECQEGAKYQFMAKAAQQQNLTALQNMLKHLAKNEMAHAERVFNVMTHYSEQDKGAKAQVDSLEGIVVNASYPFKNGKLIDMMCFTADAEKHIQDVVYKEFGKTAKSEGFDDIAIMFNELASVEGDHSNLIDELCTMLKKGTLYSAPAKSKWKCSMCGYETEDKAAPQVCNLCKAPQGAYYIKTSLFEYFKP